MAYEEELTQLDTDIRSFRVADFGLLIDGQRATEVPPERAGEVEALRAAITAQADRLKDGVMASLARVLAHKDEHALAWLDGGADPNGPDIEHIELNTRTARALTIRADAIEAVKNRHLEQLPRVVAPVEVEEMTEAELRRAQLQLARAALAERGLG